MAIINLSKLKSSEKIQCIYKLNYPNNLIYIGITNDLKRRMWEHQHPRQDGRKIQNCDQAILDLNFELEEIEILEISNDYDYLLTREEYWIQFYNARNKEIGYNIAKGGNSWDGVGEEAISSVFTNEQVLDIRKRRFNGERKKDVYQDYSNFSFSTFEHVWLGRGYTNIGQEYLIETNSISRSEYSSKANAGVKNGRAKASVEDVLQIRRRRDKGETYSSILKDFPHLTKNIVTRIGNRQTFKDIPEEK